MDINVAAASNLNYWHQEAKARNATSAHYVAGSFGQILAQLTANEAESSSEVEDGIGTVTLTKLLADGSLVILKVEGNRVVSEVKLDGSSVVQQQQLRGLNVMQQSYAGAASSDNSTSAISVAV